MQNLGIKRDILNAMFWVSIFWVILDYMNRKELVGNESIRINT